MATSSKTHDLLSVKGVGPQTLEKLARIGLHSLRDLLLHLPLRYQDRTQVVPIAALHVGQEVLTEGTVQSSEVVMGRKRSLLCRVEDDEHNAVTLRFFHFHIAQKEKLHFGARLRLFGEVRQGPTGLEMVHPEYTHLHENRYEPLDKSLTPVYPSTDGVSQGLLKRLTDQALRQLDEGEFEDLIPKPLRLELGLAELHESLQIIHRPRPDHAIELLLQKNHPAQQRLAFEELLAQRLSLRQIRKQTQEFKSPQLLGVKSLFQKFQSRLPFALTNAQQRAIREISADLAHTKPMLRLLQGDVGSGKTVVAALAVLQAVKAGYQTAVMAPTELLAEQHLRTFREWLSAWDIEVSWLTGRTKGKERQAVLEDLRENRVQVVVGTHALFQEEVVFKFLGLVVIDEQHRFGVHQRLALREKGRKGLLNPHQLIMTATPIPRTLAMSAYADLDVSVIDELPPGRQPVVTVAIPDQRRDEVISRVSEAINKGRQAYWVCTLVEESEVLVAQAAEATAQTLREQLPELTIGLVHGRLNAEEKESAMAAFKAGESHLLVATTVIEVGVDVPNASLMIIENPERLGLAQLHQLRGRVGRGSVESSCVLMYRGPLSSSAKQRLDVLRRSNDGFEIAQKDLELRGPGEVLGTRQTGVAELRIADLQRDGDLLDDVCKAADLMLNRHTDKVDALIERWLGEDIRYGEVG